MGICSDLLLLSNVSGSHFLAKIKSKPNLYRVGASFESFQQGSTNLTKTKAKDQSFLSYFVMSILKSPTITTGVSRFCLIHPKCLYLKVSMYVLDFPGGLQTVKTGIL